MPLYTYTCDGCGAETEGFARMADSDQPGGACACGGVLRRDCRHLTTVGGTVPHGWTDGKEIFQLHPKDPLRMVTSKRQMEEVYRKRGLDPDTGTVSDAKKFDAARERQAKPVQARNQRRFAATLKADQQRRR